MIYHNLRPIFGSNLELGWVNEGQGKVYRPRLVSDPALPTYKQPGWACRRVGDCVSVGFRFAPNGVMSWFKIYDPDPYEAAARLLQALAREYYS